MFTQSNPLFIFIGLVVAVALFALGYFLRKLTVEKALESAELNAKKVLEDAKKEAENKRREVEIEAKDLQFKIKAEFEEASKEKRQELTNLEKRLLQKEENVERKGDVLDKKEKEIRQREAVSLNMDKADEHE